eukprot:1143456-Pelagomonas_calceolata.AAC.8
MDVEESKEQEMASALGSSTPAICKQHICISVCFSIPQEMCLLGFAWEVTSEARYVHAWVYYQRM